MNKLTPYRSVRESAEPDQGSHRSHPAVEKNNFKN